MLKNKTVLKEVYKSDVTQALYSKIKEGKKDLTDKELHDSISLVRILTSIEHKKANKMAYKIVKKLKRHIKDKKAFKIFRINVEATLSTYEGYDFEFTKKEHMLITPERLLALGKSKKIKKNKGKSCKKQY